MEASGDERLIERESDNLSAREKKREETEGRQIGRNITERERARLVDIRSHIQERERQSQRS